ncbi:MAG: hypothetical protein NWS64_03445 [Microbacteriaceae bacterium]|nr:hypothetical protein [Microbacteriaceae bacterium]
MIRQLTVAAITAGLVLAPVTAASAITLDLAGNFPVFENPGDVDRGVDAEVGDFLDYEDVVTVGGVTVDAQITVLTVDGLIGVIDSAYDNSEDPSWPQIFSQMRFQEQANGGGKVRYRIDFTDHATGDPVTLSGLQLTILDVDETQYIQATNVSSYLLSSTPATALYVRTPNDLASIPEGEIRIGSPSIAIEPEDEDYWASLSFENTSSITLELGQGNFDDFEWAYYYLDFQSPTWTVAPTQTDTPPLTRNEELAPTGATDVSLLAVSGAIGLLAVAATLRRQRRFSQQV